MAEKSRFSMKTRFDAEAFALVVHTKRFMAAEKMGAFAARMGVSRDTVYRAERKRQIALLSFLTLCHGLSEHPFTFFFDAGGKRVGPRISAEALAQPDVPHGTVAP